jgi:hypothetical protein
MSLDHRIRYDGPYLHVDLPDAVPPDWDAVRRDLDPDAFVSRAFITAPPRMAPEDEAALDEMRVALADGGAGVVVVRIPEFAERVAG